jgi:uncharacterized repeat protein (TIGR01451 family)
MTGQIAQRRKRHGEQPPLRQRARVRRLWLERLEDRLMLDSGGLPAAIVVGRTLATPSTAATAAPSPSYFVGEVENNQVTITYTVYNEAADTETGVLLTDTLKAGVSVVSSTVTLDGTTTTQPPDQSGQNLAWSLAPIQGYDRESVALTVKLPALGASQTTPFAIDTGAQAYAMLDAGAVSASTPAATIQPGNVSDPSLLASTPDANTNDPYIQEEAAALNYDPTQIFDFLNTQIGYQSYAGSVRGARGTLWSGSGNALDVASLGVALMRASGIPAQYAQGTLSQAQAQSLILSMFPSLDQTTGYVPSGTATSDPADDSDLLSESENHYWFQFDASGGMKDADPLMPGATIGQTFATTTGTFGEVPDALREKTEVQIVAEITSAGLFGGSSADTTVLDHTFNDVDLVGHPLSFGNMVSGSSAGFIITATTFTYTPYVTVGDDANPDPSRDETITGTPYQEVFSNFPFVSSEVTGLFLNVTESGPQGAAVTYQKTLFDGIGYAVRQNGGTPEGSGQPAGSPSISPLEIWTMDVQTGLQDPTAVLTMQDQLSSIDANLSSELANNQTTVVPATLNDVLVVQTRTYLASLLAMTDQDTQNLAESGLIAAYAARPRLVVMSANLLADSTTDQVAFEFEADLLDDSVRSFAAPGQATSVLFTFNYLRGIVECADEADVFPRPAAGSPVQVSVPVGAVAVLNAANQQNVPVVTLDPGDTAALDALALPADAKARIATALLAGQQVVVPGQEVTINGQPQIAWLQTNLTTGETTGVGADGSHQAIALFAAGFVGGVISSAIAYKLLYDIAYQIGATQATIIFNNLEIVTVLNFYNAHPNQKGHPFHDLGFTWPGRSKGDTKRAARMALENEVQQVKLLVAEDIPFNNPLLHAAALGFYHQIDQLLASFEAKYLTDPPLAPVLTEAPVSNLNVDATAVDAAAAAAASAGPVAGSAPAAGVEVAGGLTASWTGTETSAFQAATLSASGATVRDSSGALVGTGSVALSVTSPVGVSVSGSGMVNYSVQGSGQLGFYGSAATGLDASAAWASYSATLEGGLALTLTTGGLTINGNSLPAGTYTIAAGSATLAGSGPSSSPVFAGSATVSATGASVALPAGSGSLTVAGAGLDPAAGATLEGYTGTIGVDASGTATLAGSSTALLQVVASAAAVASDQNTAATDKLSVRTSDSGNFSVFVQGPVNWSVTLDTQGSLAVSPVPGTQGGAYSVEIIAQSEADPSFEAQTVVEVTVIPTQPGLAFSVEPDPLSTVPYNGAQLPTAFAAALTNLGPAADTYSLSLSSPPAGFTYLTGPTTLTIPAGQTGQSGIYLEPDPGQPIPAPGTRLSFTVTATSTTDSSITQTQTETFTVPNIDAIAMTATPTALSTIPGGPVTDTITFTNAGNVAENNITLTDTLPSGLALTGLAPVSLAVGQSNTETITLTPSSSTPLNSTLDATVTATFGPSAAPVTQTVNIPVSVAVPGAAAIANASVAAGQLGNTNLANRLSDLSTALTNLVQNPTSEVYMSQSVASLTTVVNLLSTDPYLGSLAPTLTADGAALAQATSASAVQAAVAQLGKDLGTVGTTLSDEASYGLDLSLLTNSQTGQPSVPTTYGIVVQNTGTQTATYDLSLSGVPSGVTAALSQTSVTLAPGASTSVAGSATNLTVTITSNSTTEVPAFTFTVQATTEEATEITRTTTGSFTARSAFVQVVSVSPNPTFTQPGGQVDVSAQILNAVNQQQQAEASFTVTSPSGNVVFTSQPVAVSLNVLTTLTRVDLGNYDTTNLADGEYAINVSIADSSGNPIPGATGQGSLLVGSPVTATLASSPAMLPSGSGTVTNTLTVNSTLGTGGQLTLEGQTAISGGASSVAIYGNYAYVAQSKGIDIVDVSSPAAPTILSTFGSSDFASGSSPVTARIFGNDLLVSATRTSGATFAVYSLSNPTSPQLLGKTNLAETFAGEAGFAIQNNNAYVSEWYYDISGGTVFAQIGNLLSVDLSNPSSPKLVGSLYPLSTAGSSFEFGAAVVNSNTVLVASTTSTKGDLSSGVGQVLVVDTSDPSSPKLVGTVDIPGANHLEAIAVDGNQAVVYGSTSGLVTGVGFPGSLVVATLDLTDPQSPKLISAHTFSIPYTNVYPDVGGIAPVGNDVYVASDGGTSKTSSDLLLIDAQNPSDIQVSSFDVKNVPSDDEVSGNLLFTTSTDGLLIYNITPPTSVPITAQVTVPTDNGVSIDSSSFSIAPTSITQNANNTETLEWNLNLPIGAASQPITWQSSITGLQPGQSLTVDQSGTIQFTDQGSPGTLTLPPQYVTGEQIIGLSPPSQTVAPAAAATYDVTLLNPTSSPVTYALAVGGVPASWVNLPAAVTVGASGSDDVSLVLTSDSFAALSDYGFTVSASGNNGAMASVRGDLILQGQPVPPDPQSHGIVASLSPAQATAGQGTSAQFIVQLTNTGSADDTFSLAATGLPSGVTASFGKTTIDVPPGASNFRDVRLVLTVAQGTSPGNYPFTVTAASTSDEAVTGATSGTLVVTKGGVKVTLNPSSGAPGSSFQETVTNTGSVADTYNLSLGGPAALVASLGMKQVTLAPGASQVVPITTGAVNFAVQGTLGLMALATSVANPQIQGAASTGLAIPSSTGMTAEFSPASKTLSSPGKATFLLMVHNTGNAQDAYSATIVGTKGPVTAALVGLDGSPAQTVPIFYLPGLSTGAIVLQADLAKLGTGAVMVEVKSLTNRSIATTSMATITAAGAVGANGPRVTGVERFGYHMMPTTLLVTFDQALDAATADDPKNYEIMGPAGRRIRVKSAVYNPANHTVTLRPSQRINIHYRYELVVDGSTSGGVADTQGLLLNSEGGGPGSNYEGSLTSRNLVIDPRHPRTARDPRRGSALPHKH